MDEKYQSKIRKLFETRLNLENELLKGHSLLLEYIENNSCTTKIDNAVYKCKIALEKAVDVNEQLIRLAGKTENPEKIIAQQELWLKKVTEMNDKVMHEAQSYKMSLEPSSFPAAGITGSKGSLQQTRSETSSRSHKTSDSAARISENRSKVSNKSKDSRKLDSHKSDKSASTRHTSTVRTMSSSEKRHELALVKRRHEELERQYQVSLRIKELENRLKFEQSQLELEQLAENHKKQLIEMELKAFELEDSSSEVSEKVAESNLTGVSQPTSKVATDRTNDWIDSVSSQASPDVASAPGLQAFTHVPISSGPTTSALLAHAIHTSNSHNHEHTALSDPGIHSYEHRAMPQFGSASLLPLQASVSFPASVPFPVNNMHSSAHVLPPPSAVPLQTMSSNITNGSFAIAQPESLPVPMLPAQPGSGFVSLSPAFAGGGFSSSGVNPTPVFFSAPNCHAAPVQTQHNLPFVPHTVSPNINDYYTSDANLWRLAATTPIFTPALCILILPQFIHIMFRILSIKLIISTTCSAFCQSNYAPSPAYPNQGCSSDRPLSAHKLAELLMHCRKDHLPEWKLAQFDGNPLNWHEWFGQFKSTVDSAVLTDDTKLTYLKTLAIAEFSYSGVMYKDALATLQRKFGQPHAIVGAHLDKLNTFPPLKMHNSENVISFSSAISGLVAVFKSLSFNDDLKSVNLLNQAVSKLPPNLKEAWSMQTVRHKWQRPTLLDFNNWLKEKAEGHERLRLLNSKAKNEEPVKPKTTKVFAANRQVTSKAQDKSKLPPCVLRKGSHALWNCAVFKETNATQRAKYVPEQKLCFACLNGNHSFRQCSRAKKCPQPEFDSTYNVLLHGAERIFPRKENSNVSNKAGTNKSKENKNTSTHAAVSDVHDIESFKRLLPIATLGVSSDVTSLLTLVLCDSASTHSWVSSSLVNRLGLVGEPVNLSNNGFNSTTVVETQRVKFTVSSEPNNGDFVFSLCAYVKDSIRIGSELINIADLQNKYPQLAPIKPIQYTLEDVEVIIGQDCYHAVRPIDFILGDDKNSPCSFRLPIGWVLSGPLPPSDNSTSSCFKCVVEDSSLTNQIKSWYELESYGAFKQVDARSAADKHALSILTSETVHNGERYIVPMLLIDSNVSLPNNYYSSLAQFKSLERRLSKDPELRERYAETIREDIRKGYVVTVEPHDPRKRSDREWYLPHHPVVNPNKPGKVRRVLNGASKFHGTSLNKSLLVGSDLLQKLIFVLLRFRQHKYAVSADIEGMFLQVGVLARDQISLRFL